MRCTRQQKCCQRTYVPLVLAFARTIHKAQGISVGPTGPGQIPNMYDVIVCDPGNRIRESGAPGILYTAVSRATTLGGPDGLGSAFYFLESARVSLDRFEKITFKKDSVDLYETVIQRNVWIASQQPGYERRKSFMDRMSNDEKANILLWAETARFSTEALDAVIDDYCAVLSKSACFY